MYFFLSFVLYRHPVIYTCFQPCLGSVILCAMSRLKINNYILGNLGQTPWYHFNATPAFYICLVWDILFLCFSYMWKYTPFCLVLQETKLSFNCFSFWYWDDKNGFWCWCRSGFSSELCKLLACFFVFSFFSFLLDTEGIFTSNDTVIVQWRLCLQLDPIIR